MKNFKSIGILSFSALVAFPLIATANPTPDVNISEIQNPQSSQKRVLIEKTPQDTINNLVKAGILTKQPTYENSSIVAQSKTFIIKDENGVSFINHTVAEQNLAQIEAQFDVIRTYEFEHNGVIYQNKVVQN